VPSSGFSLYHSRPGSRARISCLLPSHLTSSHHTTRQPQSHTVHHHPQAQNTFPPCCAPAPLGLQGPQRPATRAISLPPNGTTASEPWTPESPVSSTIPVCAHTHVHTCTHADPCTCTHMHAHPHPERQLCCGLHRSPQGPRTLALTKPALRHSPLILMVKNSFTAADWLLHLGLN
jgi:hypothetical protein